MTSPLPQPTPPVPTATTDSVPADERALLLSTTGSPRTRSESIETAARLLRSDLPVAFPTETVYGLGASALSSKAVKRIFEAKGRPSDNPLIVHIGNKDMLNELLPRRRRPRTRTARMQEQTEEEEGDWEVFGMNDMYKCLIEKFWPGPLSLIFKLEPPPEEEEERRWREPSMRVAPEVTAGQPSLCIRMPNHELALELLEQTRLPLAAPSANLSSRPSPTSAKHVMDDLGHGRGVGAVLDGGSCDVGVESTVVDYLDDADSGTGRLRILRAGGISQEAIEECLTEAGFETARTGGGGIVQVYSRDFKSTALESNPTTPGMKYKHYAPGNSKVVLVKAVADNKFLPSLQELIQLTCLTHAVEGKRFRVGLMLTDKTLSTLLLREPGKGAKPEEEEEKDDEVRPDLVRLREPRASLFAQLTENEESNLPELDSIEVWSLPLSLSSAFETIRRDAARRLFRGLRTFDSMKRDGAGVDEGQDGVDLILVECVEEKGVGLAVMERARKAAGGIERGGEMEFAL
ncbi:hypothetical protein JCM3766R1_006063 [Sporobolomyces carnicolor]